PPLQNKLWNILVRGRFNPVAHIGDLQKAFLQVRVRESDRDVMCFHWRRNEQSELEKLRFTMQSVIRTRAISLSAGGRRRAGFKLHKWHSNAQELVESAKSSADDDTYAKQQLGTPPGPGETVMTKRGILAKLAKVYDPLGLVSPITLSGKIIYLSVCDDKIGWDVPLPEPLVKMWRKWESSLLREVQLPTRDLP
ncbi:hypothetical protein QZH41_009805, partial [Actinostola sp. cb2023]